MHKSMVLFYSQQEKDNTRMTKIKLVIKLTVECGFMIFFMNIKLENILQKEGGSLC